MKKNITWTEVHAPETIEIEVTAPKITWTEVHAPRGVDFSPRKEITWIKIYALKRKK